MNKNILDKLLMISWMYIKILNVLKNYLPFIEWFEGYDSSRLKADLVGGLTVAMVLIPQSIAYAQLAGLPPSFGLYTAFLPPIVATLFSRSPHINTGPVAIVTLMISTALEPLAAAGSAEYVTYALLLTLLVGLFQFSLGIFRMGMIVNFMSHPVANGFTNAAAVIIATSQLAALLGIQIDNAKHHYETLIRVAMAARVYIHLPTIGMSALAFLIIIGLKKIHSRIPGVLAAVVITTIISWATGYEMNTTSGMDRIDSPQVVEDINTMNSMVMEYNKLAEKRIALVGNRARIIRAHGRESFETLKADADISLVKFRIENQREEINIVKSVLRSYVFESYIAEDGSPSYRLRDKSRRGRVWRLSVGRESLDPASMTFMSG